MSDGTINVNWHPEEKTAYCVLNGEQFIIRCPDDYDPSEDDAGWIVKEVVQILNHRQLFRD